MRNGLTSINHLTGGLLYSATEAWVHSISHSLPIAAARKRKQGLKSAVIWFNLGPYPNMAVGQNQGTILGSVNSPPILVYFSGDWDVHWWYGNSTQGHICGLFIKSLIYPPLGSREPGCPLELWALPRWGTGCCCRCRRRPWMRPEPRLRASKVDRNLRFSKFGFQL